MLLAIKLLAAALDQLARVFPTAAVECHLFAVIEGAATKDRLRVAMLLYKAHFLGHLPDVILHPFQQVATFLGDATALAD